MTHIAPGPGVKSAAAMPVPHDPRQNHLLAALPEEDFERVSADLRLVPLELGNESKVIVV